MFQCCCADGSVEGAAEDTISAPALSTAEQPGEAEPKLEDDPKLAEPQLEEPPQEVKKEEVKKEEPKQEEPKPPEKEVKEPVSPLDTFEVMLDTTNDPIGLTVDHRAGTLMVVSASSGAIQAHNQSAEASQQVKPADFIVRVNDTTDAAEMMRVLVQKGNLKVKIQRVVPFKASVTKGGQTLGMKLAYVASCPSITITDILEGAVMKYNKDVQEGVQDGVQIKAKDRIVGVGDVNGDVHKMVDALKAGETLDLLIARVSPEASG